MTRKAQNDFEELELYLQQAQDELLSSLAIDERPEGDCKIASKTEGDVADFEGQNEVADGNRNSLNDFLDSYDNVEFFKENKTKLCVAEKVKIKNDHIDDQNNNTINGNVKGEKPKKLCTSKLKEAKEIIKEKEIKRSKDSGQEGNPRKGNIKSVPKRTSKKTESDALRENNKQQLAGSKSKPRESLTCKDVKNRSQGSQVVLKTGNRNNTDDLSDCNISPNDTCSRSSNSQNLKARPTDRNSKLKPCQEASTHLPLAGNDHKSGSLIKVTHENSSPFIEADIQIDGKQSSYLTGDKSQLDNGESDKEIEGGTLMSLQLRNVATLENDGCFNGQVNTCTDNITGNYKSKEIIEEKNEVKIKSGNLENVELYDKNVDNKLDLGYKAESKLNFSDIIDSSFDDKKLIRDDLEEFLEEINESIDELISEGKIEMSESLVSVNSKIGVSNGGISCLSRSDITDGVAYGTSRSIMSDSGLSLISRSDISESCISYTSTDSGYSASNIGQSGPDQRKENIEKDGSKMMESDILKNNTDGVQNEGTFKNVTKYEEQEVIDVVNKVNEDRGEVIVKDKGEKDVEEVVETDEGFYWVTSSIEEGESKNASENVSDCKIYVDVEDNVVSKINSQKETVKNNAKEKKDIISDKISVNRDNKKDIRNLLKLPVGCKDLKLSSFSSGISSHRKGKDQETGDLDNLDNEDFIKNSSLKRKYSCPMTVFRVFKVVSVDIPKIETGSRSGSNESIKRCSLKGHEKGHLNHHKSDIGVNESKCHSLETLLSKKKEEHGNKKQLKEKFDKNGFKMSIEPPLMFRDKKDEDVNNGPILRPPPDFDTTGQTAAMDTQHFPPPVWDPGVSSATSCLHSGDVNIELPLTPPPPSAGMTEKLISSTLNQYKQRKFSADASSDLTLLKPPESVRRKSADSGNTSEYIDLDSYQKSSSETLNSIKDDIIGKTGAIELKTEDHRYNCLPDIESDSSAAQNIICGNVKGLNSSEYQEILPKTETNNDIPDMELAKMLDLIESYQINDESDNEKNSKNIVLQDKESLCHKQVLAKTESNISESLDRRKSGKGTENEDDPSAIYATVDKFRPRKPSPEKVVPERSSQTPPPIPPKPKFLSEAFNDKKSVSDIDSAQSTDLQVMFNSLSPVLLRRNNSSRSHRKQGSSTETSPDSTPDVSPRGRQNHQDEFHRNQGNTGTNAPNESLFMDPEMAKTWHGATSTDWSQYYGPQMRAMMKELNRLNNVEMKSNNNNVNKSAESLDDSKSKTLPSKSLLDEMHKKFCADQYMNEKDIEMTRALVLFRLKSKQPPSKARRSQSFNIRMGMGASYSKHGKNGSSSSASSDSSPRFPRSSERLRIKTRPDVQYSPKPIRARGATPEPQKTEDLNTQAQNTQKEEAGMSIIFLFSVSSVINSSFTILSYIKFLLFSHSFVHQ